MIKKTILCLCLLCLSLGQACRAEAENEEGVSLSRGGVVELRDASLGFLNLSLVDAVVLALKTNLDVDISRIDPLIEDKDISIEKAPFDPVLKMSGEIRKDETPLNSIFVTGTAPVDFLIQSHEGDAELSMLTPIGATVAMEYDFIKRARTPSGGVAFDPATDTFIEGRITAPLLKKFGIFYNRSKIYMAQNDKKKSIYALRGTAIDIANEVQIAYWDLVKGIENLKVAHKSLQRAQEFMRNNELQVQAGILAPIDLAVDKEEVALREEQIIIAEDEVQDREDKLKLLMNFLNPDVASWLSGITIVPLDKPVWELRDVDLNDSIRVALGNRPEIFEKKLELDNADIETRRKKNELLPQLDIEGGVRFSGLGKAWNDSQDSTFSTHFQSEYAKISLELPIGLRKERAEYAKAKYEERRAKLEFTKQEQEVIFDVRDAARQVQTTKELVKSTKKTLEAAQERLDAEEKKYKVGRTTNLEVFRAQESLAIQEARRNKALGDYHIALGELEAAKGTLLERLNIILEQQALGNDLIY
ncbi:MAG: hypothetical protein A3I59_08190 [Planctomycetes bacterium RIFCSPLOWO2_02_FULL_50_16]|nr:MAG: hypothetical protein A3I59_08190 [Planctomycetes bacterium RIFCSPLOWO2_02_FULL_50_16]